MQTTKGADSKAIGQTATIGRFGVEVIEDGLGLAGEPLVEFRTTGGDAFGSIRLSTAKAPVAVDLYESAMWRLGLPISFDVSDYCLTKDEMEELQAWANGLAA